MNNSSPPLSSQKDMFKGQTDFGTSPPELILSLSIPGRLPSWNEILGMEYWARDRFKQQLQADFLSALSLCANDSSTRTTSARSTLLTAYATLACYRETVLAKRKSRRAKKKLTQAEGKKLESKFTESKPPF